jgi:predicted SnoaL-like aldol condensation-catalyzing enzyme
MTKLKQNKENAIAFYDLMFNLCKNKEAIEKCGGDTYTQRREGKINDSQA